MFNHHHINDQIYISQRDNSSIPIAQNGESLRFLAPSPSNGRPRARHLTDRTTRSAFKTRYPKKPTAERGYSVEAAFLNAFTRATGRYPRISASDLIEFILLLQ